MQKGVSSQVRCEVLTGYLVSLQKQLREAEKLILGTRARGLGGPVHNILPADYVYVKSLSDSPLEPKWEGPFQVLLTSHAAIKIKEQAPWIYHTWVKKVQKPSWTVKQTGLLRLSLKKQND